MAPFARILLLAIALEASAHAQEQARVLTVAATGDLLLHTRVVASAEHHGWPHVFSGLQHAVTASDLTLANLETPLDTTVRTPITGSPPILGAPPEAAQALADAGIDVLACANNHAHDQDALGLQRTLHAVQRAGLPCVGASEDPERAFEPVFVHRNGLRIGVVAFTETLNRGPGFARGGAQPAFVAWTRSIDPLPAIRQARANADLVIVQVHWSFDYATHPDRGQRNRAQAFVEAGADLVLGTGAHLLQEVERIRSLRGEAVIAYSLGNAVSNQGLRYRVGRNVSMAAHPAVRLAETRDGVLLRTHFAVRSGRIEVTSIDAIPLWTNNNFWERDAILHEDPRSDPPTDIHVSRLREAPIELKAVRRAAIEAALGSEVQLLE